MNRHGQSDEWLMGQVARGGRQHVAPLVRRYASGLLTYIQRMTGDRHRSEELVQEVFLLVWTKRKKYKFPKSFRAWLFTIATNRCRADFRRLRPEVASPMDETSATAVPVAAGPSPAEATIAVETAQLVTGAVAQLPPGQRTVVTLRVWNGLSYAEIAEIVGCAEATVRSHMHHGLAAMRRYLETRMAQD